MMGWFNGRKLKATICFLTLFTAFATLLSTRNIFQLQHILSSPPLVLNDLIDVEDSNEQTRLSYYGADKQDSLAVDAIQDRKAITMLEVTYPINRGRSDPVYYPSEKGVAYSGRKRIDILHEDSSENHSGFYGIPIIFSEPLYCNIVKHPFFPLCREKFDYIQKYVAQDKCFYRVHKVVNSSCSILNYLTQVEPYCVGKKEQYKDVDLTQTTQRFELNGLLEILSGKSLQWLRERAKFVWPHWMRAGLHFSKLYRGYKNKNVVLYMGAMNRHRYFLEDAGKGGPLGELVQWVDLITSLYVLGYNITLFKKLSQLSTVIRGNDKYNCATSKYGSMVDVIYTDISGILMLRRKFGDASLAKYNCKFRVLDSFGTYAEYNYPNYPHSLPGGKSVWGNNNLLLPQFLTLYPHTHDNRFLGFVVTKPNNTVFAGKERNIALLYAKLSSYIKDHARYIEIVSEYFEIHATCSIDSYDLPSFIHNHGPVSQSEVQHLLSEAKLFVGVGFPYEGPGPMEAMAAGTVYLQPKFSKPKNKVNTHFFSIKPTLRELTSQSPYMEEYVGEPYCYTINVDDEVVLRKTLQKIKYMKPLLPKIPREFTNEGMIERVYAFTNSMEYCYPYSPRWPPITNLQVLLGRLGESCKDVCMLKGFVCEHSYFHDINVKELIEKIGGIRCEEEKEDYLLHSPSFNPSSKTCYLQKHGQLFSCMHHENGVRRLCPCRDYEFEQTAICKNCL